MPLTEYCTKSEKQNGCMGLEWLQVYQWFPLWLSRWLGAAAHYCSLYGISYHINHTTYCQPRERPKFKTLYKILYKKGTGSTKYVPLHTVIKLKNPTWNHHKPGILFAEMIDME